MLRTIGAILAGLAAVVILSIGTDMVMFKAGVFPPLGQPLSDKLCVLATIYRSVYSVVGSYIAARLAPDRPMGHALALGLLGVVVSTLGAVVTWNKGLGPHWYPVALIVLSLPCAWLGGRLYRPE
jgi:uncharacterized membrane protein